MTPASATGTVTFYDGITVLGIAALNSGSASITTRALAPGTRSVTAYYFGDTNNEPTSATALTLTIDTVPSIQPATEVNRAPRSRRPRPVTADRAENPASQDMTGDLPAAPTTATPNWTSLNNQPGIFPDTALLLTDGTVLVHGFCSENWRKLTPDALGSYINGTWSQVASMPKGYGPYAFSSAVLPDGRLVVIGGEYNESDGCQSPVDTNMGAVYDPVADAWVSLAPPAGAGFTKVGDASNVVLPSGQFLLAGFDSTQIAALNAPSLTWTVLNARNKADGWYGEEGWTLLPNGTVLTVDTNDGLQSEIYTPSTDSWALAGSTVANLITGTEVGPALVRPDGTVFATGATGHTAIYNTATGAWSAGPDFPTYNGAQLAVADGPAVLLPDGNVLVGASPFNPTLTKAWSAPTQYFEFDGVNINAVPSPSHGFADYTYETRLLPLPTGQVMFSDLASIEIYTPAGQADPSWAPTISNAPATVAPGQTYTVAGTQFNGLSQAAAYGDDVQNATNYPLVRITNMATGHVFYCRTHDHSTMAVATGSAPVFTQFDAGSIETGPSTLVVVANGIASEPWAVNVISNSLSAQTITFGTIGNQILGTAPFPLSATSSSGLAVTFLSGTTAVCTVSGSTATLLATGTCSITAIQAGNATFAPATPVTQSFTISPAVGAAPVIVNVQNAATYQINLAPNTYVVISGQNLSTTNPGRAWTASDFTGNSNGTFNMPASLDGTSAMIGGAPAYINYVSPGQLNIITPPNVTGRRVPVVVQVNGQVSAAFDVTLQSLAPSFFTWQPPTADFGKYLIAQHADGSDVGKTGLFPSAPALTTPAKPGETIILYGTGFGPTSPPIANGIETDQVYSLSPTPAATFGGDPAKVVFGG